MAIPAGQVRFAEDFKIAPYWWDAAPRPSGQRPPLPATADVAVVGAGFTGLSAALTLARAGRSVVVFDAGVPGFGASTRNGGQVGSGNQKFPVATLEAMHGKAKAHALLREGQAMLDHIARLVADEGIDCGFVRCGRFRGAMTPGHYDAMARDLEALDRVIDMGFATVPRHAQHAEIGSDFYFGGSLLPNDACLHPGLYHQGLLERVAAAGATVAGETAVQAIDGCAVQTVGGSVAPGFTVRTAFGSLRCRDVVVATNGYTDRALPYFRDRIVPIESAVIATEPLPPALMHELMPKRRVHGCTARVFHYFRPSPDGTRMVWGGRVARLVARTAPKAFHHLYQDMCSVFPQLAGVALSHGWVGYVGYSYDELPHLGVVDGIHYAVGYCGTGVSRSTYFGHKIARRLLGAADGRTAFDDIALPRHPFHAVATPAVPFVEGWYRALDWKDRLHHRP